jgi:type I restriction enzyme S subunit
MPNNWKTYKLEKVATLQRGFDLPNTKRIDGIYPVIAASGFSTYHNVFKVKAPGVTTGRSGTLGQVHYVNKDFWPLNTSLWVKDFNGNDERFIYYILQTLNFEEYNSGTSVPTLNRNDVHKLDVTIPDLPEQKSIAQILSTIDEKIENNLAINKTLEEMAMALYKHWFVDFGPFQNGEFIESELGSIPKGWEVKKIGDVIETLGGGTPSTTKTEYWENGEILWYSPTDLTRENSMYSFDSAKKINALGLQKSSAKLFPANSLLMSSRATIGLLTINTKEASTNQGFITMLPNEKLTIYQLYFWTKHNMELIISKANGSTFKEISKSNFRDLDIIVANDIEKYIEESKDIFEQIKNNTLENQSLTQLRDTLLPKLISGEVRLKEFREAITN